ncbi:MAG: ABC transporter permease [Actinobacteria bacterium]|nr:ABC transporter permease [Actinomycetota bacterium]
MRAFRAGFALELWIIRSNPDALMPLFTAPLFAIIFMAIVRQSGRPDLESDALMAPVLMTLLWVALQHAGTLMVGDRWQALLEPIIASPTSLASVLLGRIMSLMCFGLLSFFEVWAVGKLVFGVSIPFEHPVELFLTLVCTALAMAGLAVTFSALLVMTRNAYTFTNSTSFPLYLLGGVFVPVAILPDWIQPVSSILFVSWSSDLLRASVNEAPVESFWPRLGMVLLLGTASFAIGRVVLHYVLRRMRASGELAAA